MWITAQASTDGNLPRQRPIPDADDNYADQTAIFAHSDKGFTTNELAMQ